jgi:Carboxypeptidase regulatory-like domain
MEDTFANIRNTKFRLMLFTLLVTGIALTATAQSTTVVGISGTVLDPAGFPLAGAQVEFDSASSAPLSVTTGNGGEFERSLPSWGVYTVHVEATGFSAISRQVDLSASTGNLAIRLEHIAADSQEVIVSTDVGQISLDSPDPSQKVMVRDQLLDANPGRPGAPISIPGMPIETAAGEIKAPQYFVPGVAGDHGEPIAQYIAVGNYLASNNLSANAHGNGYADPNIYVSGVLGGVGTDGGVFNVLEGNHALNLATTYSLRPHVRRFLTLTGDYRDIDLTAGFSPADPAKKAWIAIEANYGNGLMRTLEHRLQYKWNAMRVFDPGNHEITLLSTVYYGHSHEGNLVPIGYGVQVNVDPRQAGPDTYGHSGRK